MEYRYDTQLLIEGRSLDEAVILGYFQSHFQGDCLLVVGDESLIKIHFHTNGAVACAGVLRQPGRDV